MHNPTRRAKRFKRSSPARSSNQLPGASGSDTGFDAFSENNSPSTSSNHARHHQATQPDTLRGAMLMALIVVTIVLYVLLWELERSSFASQPVPKPHFNPLASSSSDVLATSIRYPPAVFRNRAGPVMSEGLDLPGDQITVSSIKGDVTPTPWPSPITLAPGERDADVKDKVDNPTDENENKKLRLSSESFDSAYCNGTCHFLLPVRIGEQESKARIHFTQLLLLARRLNRTIALPRVGKGRISPCSTWPFGAYYDATQFAYRDDSPDPWLAMDLERFTRWVEGRPVPPSGFVVSMDSTFHEQGNALGTSTRSEDVPFVVGRTEVDPKITSCLESSLARIHSNLPEMALSVSFDSASLKMEPDSSAQVVKLLSNNLDLDSDLDLMTGPGYEYTPQHFNSSYIPFGDIDVLILDYDLRHPLFAASVQPNFDLHYAPVLYDLADRLSDNLGPFLAVHWRMENVPVQNLAWCAASLVSTLRGLLQDDVAGDNMRYVWLATDHPRSLSTFMDPVRFPVDDGDGMLNGLGSGVDESVLQEYGPRRKSSTFKALTPEHDDAIETLVEAFRPGGDLEGWKLTDLSEQLAFYPYVEGRFELNEALLGDSGVFGILDKLVNVQARVFVSGSTECSKTSSFSKQIVEARQRSLEGGRGKGAIHNVVEYFGKW